MSQFYKIHLAFSRGCFEAIFVKNTLGCLGVKVLVLFPFSMASQNPRMDPTMRIPEDILPKFEALKIALRKECKGDVLRWVSAKCAPHIQALLQSNVGPGVSSSGTGHFQATGTPKMQSQKCNFTIFQLQDFLMNYELYEMLIPF
jgi:hypothetical protein